MSSNRTLGPVQVYGLTVAEINLALLEVQNRIDEMKGLRGRAMVYDRQRIDDPTASDDAVSLGILQAGTAFATVALHMAANAPLLASAPGTSYVELGSLLRSQVNFASPQSLEGRVIVEGWGTESGASKGVAVTQSDGTVIAQVTWDGNGVSQRTGSFTSIALTTDQVVQVRVKGSSASESLVLHSIVLDLRYSIDVLD